MIRFYFFLKFIIIELKKEVGRRLNLEMRIFKFKYLDDDDEWVLLVCDLNW